MYWLALSAVILVIDQVSKTLAEQYLVLGQPQAVIDGFFNLRLAYNPGAAFSFLGSAGGWQRWFFIGLAIVVSIWLTVWLRSVDRSDRATSIGLALIIGGAVGNVWDRIAPDRQMVVDFLDFYVGRWHWPAFNVADIAICCGAALLVYTMFRDGRQQADSSKA